MEKTQILYKLREFFQEQKDIKTVILYGSAAEDRLTDSSDIDIAVGGKAPLPMERLLELNGELQVLFKRNIDLVDINCVRGLIHYKIMTRGIRLIGTSKTFTDEMVRAIGFGTDFLPQLMDMQRKRIEKSLYGS